MAPIEPLHSWYHHNRGSKWAESIQEGEVETLPTTDWSERIITNMTRDILHRPVLFKIVKLPSIAAALFYSFNPDLKKWQLAKLQPTHLVQSTIYLALTLSTSVLLFCCCWNNSMSLATAISSVSRLHLVGTRHREKIWYQKWVKSSRAIPCSRSMALDGQWSSIPGPFLGGEGGADGLELMDGVTRNGIRTAYVFQINSGTHSGRWSSGGLWFCSVWGQTGTVFSVFPFSTHCSPVETISPGGEIHTAKHTVWASPPWAVFKTLLLCRAARSSMKTVHFTLGLASLQNENAFHNLHSALYWQNSNFSLLTN